MTGRVKTLNEEKKYGFIRGEDRKDYFFYHSESPNLNFSKLKVNDLVSFEPTVTPKGPRAIEVKAV